MNKTTMQTFTGALVDLAAFTSDHVRLPDIAHALSLVNRFTGHTVVPYTVAQHSVVVSRLCPPEHALWGLLHDASEAYLGDVARPLKHLLREYRELEAHVQREIARRFGLQWPMPECVHEADMRALLAEKEWLLSVQHDWGMQAAPIASPQVAWSWQESKEAFTKRAKELLE
ncbi:MAG: metal-dependent phosphohydrolase [Betaproteobacteria bacterium]|nr:metal-dependent phosphohydrolase [Betaproteobacteria bacterium]